MGGVASIMDEMRKEKFWSKTEKCV